MKQETSYLLYNGTMGTISFKPESRENNATPKLYPIKTGELTLNLFSTNLYLQDGRKRMENLEEKLKNPRDGGKFGVFSISKVAFHPMPISQKYNTQVPFSVIF